ncbi:unnamed protein product [Chrysodeixis includens]|uniref:Arrestin C-terminal-like domain-containing protein n=1 Tax=Chrysodeixis includens TaxID=689277 RepID=A0A9N8KV30_CHRIL|nr:unnamed protein product [Chrysodeixis includens]
MPISGVRTELICHMTYISNAQQEWPVTKTVKGTAKDHPGIKEKSESTATYVVSTLMDLFSIQNSAIIAKEYKVKITLKLPFPHKNATLELPVVIDKVHYETDDNPPSYWQAMYEEKYKDVSELELKTVTGVNGSFEKHST